ncbi:MAG TPA: DUF4142 domain-containing protein [Flavisolibacter sp.]|jgi:putative membrane protein|nr:DUF4142 domain-containing protein [Flavisolibacter sp.]
MKKVLLMAGLSAVLFVACSKDDNNDNNVNSTDQSFMVNVAMSNTAEVMAGQLAVQKGTSAAVKMYGQMMATEHTEAQSDLKSLAGNYNMTVPDTVDMENKMVMARLQTLSGYAFDTAYINSQVKGHAKTLGFFQDELSNGSAQNVKSYASKYLPHIQMHYNTADSIRKTL